MKAKVKNIEAQLNGFCYYLMFIYYLHVLQPLLELVTINLVSILIDKSILDLDDIQKVYAYSTINSPVIVSIILDLTSISGTKNVLGPQDLAKNLWSLIPQLNTDSPKLNIISLNKSQGATKKIDKNKVKVFNLFLIIFNAVFLVYRKILINNIDNILDDTDLDRDSLSKVKSEILKYEWKISII